MDDNQSANQPINQSIVQSVNQSMKQSVEHAGMLYIYTHIKIDRPNCKE